MKIQKQKLFFSVLLLCSMILSLFTGCNVKFIERIPDNNSSSFDTSGTRKYISSSSSQIPSTTDSITSQPGTLILDGVKFIQITSTSMYTKSNNTPILKEPFAKSDTLNLLTKNTMVIINAISVDKKFVRLDKSSINMQSDSNQLQNYFVDYSKLSTTPTSEKLSVSSSSSKVPTTTSSNSTITKPTSKSPSTSQNQTKQPAKKTLQSNQSNQWNYSGSSNNIQNNSQSQQITQTGGLQYPQHPSSVSKNLGVLFADVHCKIITIRATSLSTGPGTPNAATGYGTYMSVPKNSIIVCTGIGRNGYDRVSVNSHVLFVQNSTVKLYS